MNVKISDAAHAKAEKELLGVMVSPRNSTARNPISKWRALIPLQDGTFIDQESQEPFQLTLQDMVKHDGVTRIQFMGEGNHHLNGANVAAMAEKVKNLVSEEPGFRPYVQIYGRI